MPFYVMRIMYRNCFYAYDNSLSHSHKNGNFICYAFNYLLATSEHLHKLLRKKPNRKDIEDELDEFESEKDGKKRQDNVDRDDEIDDGDEELYL